MAASAHRTAVLQAFLVTFIWSTSWVLVKFGLAEVPALTFAGLRYVLAFACLVPFMFRPGRWTALRRLTRRDWLRLVGLGLLLYTFTQGAVFVGLAYLPAVTVSLMLNFTTLVVAFGGILFLSEYPTRLQWFGVILFMAGILVYFYPVNIPPRGWIGLVVVLIGVFTNAAASILGRSINRETHIHPLLVTIISMGIGAIILLVIGVAVQGLPPFSLVNWGIILWLAVVNTAFAFSLWNLTLRTLSAMESSIINGTMLVQVAILAWIFLGERLNWQTGLGLLMAGIGAILVQVARTRFSPVDLEGRAQLIPPTYRKPLD